MFHLMDTLASSSRNPYARNYLTKSRRDSDDNSNYLIQSKNTEDKAKKVKIENDITEYNYDYHSFYTEDDQNYDSYDQNYGFNRAHELSSDNCSYTSFNDEQPFADENIAIIDDTIEEYSIDFIDDVEDILPENVTHAIINDTENVKYAISNDPCYDMYEDPTLYSNVYNCNRTVRVPSKSKRKQGIVGRPPLSSPQRLVLPDNVYSHEVNYKCFKENNQRVRKNVSKKLYKQSDSQEEVPHHNGSKSRPRILLKPTIPNYRSNNTFSYKCVSVEQDANQVAQFHVANRQFARTLVARAERQGIVIDKNKIPLSVLQQDPTDQRYQTYDELGTVIAEIKKSDQMDSFPYTTTLNITDSRKTSPNHQIVIQKQDLPPKLPSPKMTASDLLKLKWKAENR